MLPDAVTPFPTVRLATATDRQAVLAFYHAGGYSPAVAEADQLFLAELDGYLVAAARLCTEYTCTVLRGMRVHPDHQRRGIGSALLALLVHTTSHRRCYCLPFAHLSGFYGRAGFTVVADSSAPPFLFERAARYRGKGEDVLVMARAPDVTGPMVEAHTSVSEAWSSR
jgi:GNAT superfamily N-acetyltransferase